METQTAYGKRLTANKTSAPIEPGGKRSVWLPKLQKSVCPEYYRETKEQDPVRLAPEAVVEPAPINPEFKLVFQTAAVGTLIFVVLCFTMSLLAGKQPPPLVDKVVMGFFDLAKIGFGTVIGLLGGKRLERSKGRARKR